jgi:hypothetical protein
VSLSQAKLLHWSLTISHIPDRHWCVTIPWQHSLSEVITVPGLEPLYMTLSTEMGGQVGWLVGVPVGVAVAVGAKVE